MTEIKIDSALRQAVAAHKEGKLDKAERGYRSVLQSDPTHPDANHNLGILLDSINKPELALPCYKVALEENPQIEQLWLSYLGALLAQNELDLANITLEKGLHSGFSGKTLKILGVLFGQKGMNAQSLKIFEVAARLMPKDCEVHNNLGASFQNCMRLQEAENSFRCAVSLNPNYVEAHYNLGCTLHSRGIFKKAERELRKSIALNFEFVAAHNNLGLLLLDLGRFQEAEASFKQAISLKIDYADPHNNLGLILSKTGRLKEAENYFKRSISLKTDFPEAHNNLGNILKELNRPEEAEQSYLKAAEYNFPKAMSNLGLLFTAKKQHARAKDYYLTALELNPKLMDAKYGLALLHLTLKEFSKGFELYEARYHSDVTDRMADAPNTFVPQYRGTNLNNDIKDKHLLICPEQGVGDEVMFASVLPALESIVKKSKETKVTLVCDPRLVDLFSRSFKFLTVIPKSEDNKYQNLENDLDYWMFIGSLPQFYRYKIEDFACQSTYLLVDKNLCNMWKKRFKKLPHKVNIGISWAGGKRKKNTRSASLKTLIPILSKANHKANIINLQYGDHKKEIEDFGKNTGIVIHDWDDCDPLKDLNNYSAQIKALDLIISIDTALVEFSGALGTKTYVLLPFDQNWRWAEESNKSYWHPNNMTLFRQTEVGKWDDVMQEVTNILD